MSSLPRIIGINPPQYEGSMRDLPSSRLRESMPELVLRFDDGAHATVHISRSSLHELQRIVRTHGEGHLLPDSRGVPLFATEPPATMTRFDRDIGI